MWKHTTERDEKWEKEWKRDREKEMRWENKGDGKIRIQKVTKYNDDADDDNTEGGKWWNIHAGNLFGEFSDNEWKEYAILRDVKQHFMLSNNYSTS